MRLHLLALSNLMLMVGIALTACDDAETQKQGEFRDCDECPIMVEIPPGSFMMGSPEDEVGRDEDEGPVHRVTIGYRFAVSKFEITMGEWHSMPGLENKTYISEGSRFPAAAVNWRSAKEFTILLSEKTGKRYRLLSEAEWEYVARAGTTGPFSFGKIGPDKALYNTRYSYQGSNATKTLKYSGLREVGSYEPNAFGLYDVHGNAFEWVEDCYRSYEHTPRDGSAAKSRYSNNNCGLRILRGGNRYTRPEHLRSAARYKVVPGFSNVDVGFRIARELD